MAWASSELTTSTPPGLQAGLSLVEPELTHAANMTTSCACGWVWNGVEGPGSSVNDLQLKILSLGGAGLLRRRCRPGLGRYLPGA